MFDKAKDMYKIQKQAREIKKQLKNTHIESEHEGVKVIINGEQEVQEILVSEEAMGDRKRLQSNLEKCFNKAIKKSQEVGAQLMKSVMGDQGFPGM